MIEEKHNRRTQLAQWQWEEISVFDNLVVSRSIKGRGAAGGTRQQWLLFTNTPATLAITNVTTMTNSGNERRNSGERTRRSRRPTPG